MARCIFSRLRLRTRGKTTLNRCMSKVPNILTCPMSSRNSSPLLYAGGDFKSYACICSFRSHSRTLCSVHCWFSWENQSTERFQILPWVTGPVKLWFGLLLGCWLKLFIYEGNGTMRMGKQCMYIFQSKCLESDFKKNNLESYVFIWYQKK